MHRGRVRAYVGAMVYGMVIPAFLVSAAPVLAAGVIIDSQRDDSIPMGQTHFATDLFNAHDPFGGAWSSALYSTTSGAFGAQYLTGVAFEPYDSRGNPDTYLLQIGTFTDVSCAVPAAVTQSAWQLPSTTSASRLITVDMPTSTLPLSGIHCIKWGAYGMANTSPYQTFANSLYGSYGNGEYPYFELLGDGALPQGPLATTTPPNCTQDCNDNVLFIPGIESSRLYAPQVVGNPERKLWEPLSSDDVRQLFMNPDGTSVRNDIYAKEGDVVDEIPIVGSNIYKSFLGMLNDLKAGGKIADWEAVPYDWRLSLDDILATGADTDGKIKYGATGATSTPYIIQELRRLAASSRTHKVTIVAHSNGGLVTKRLTQMLGPDAQNLVGRIIFVDVPQAGTPVAIAAGLHGYGQELGFGHVLDASTARMFANSAPMTYNLMPSSDYFAHVTDPVISFDPSLADWIARYGPSVHTPVALRSFLTDTFGRVDPQAGDIAQPVQMSGTLYDKSAGIHASLDGWVPPEGVSLIQLAGWGIPTTVSGIRYTKSGGTIKAEPVFTIDGDGTVVAPSQVWVGTSSAGVVNLWADLQRYNRDTTVGSGFGLLPFDHSRILETAPVLALLHDALSSNALPALNYSYITNVPPTSVQPRLRYSLHSPLTLDLFDGQGRHTGVSTSTGQIEAQVPGTYYAAFGDVKYIFTDTTSISHIQMRGYSTSTFTFKTEQLIQDGVVASTTWQNMPVTPRTVVSIDIQSDISTQSGLRIDSNGDGVPEYDLAPRFDMAVEVPKPKLLIVADNKIITKGAPMPALTASLFGLASSTPNDVTGTALCTTTATSTSSPGVYPIICGQGSLSSNNYTFGTTTPGTLTIVYRCDGFVDPINNHGREVRDEQDDKGERDDASHNPSIFKAGSTVPVKFQFRDTFGRLISTTAAPLWLTPQRGGSMQGAVDESMYSDPSDSGASYQKDGQQYRYNWKTGGLLKGYWYRIYAKLANGQLCSVTLGLK